MNHYFGKEVESNVFDFYIDEANVGKEIQNKFQLIREHIKTNTDTEEEMQ